MFDCKTHGIEITYMKITNHFPDLKIPSLRTVFNWINSDLWVVKRSYRLRTFYKKGRKRELSVTDRLVGKRWIRPYWSRPEEINDRRIFGHWEIDLIVGKYGKENEHLLTFVERKTRYGIIKKVKSKSGWVINKVLRDLIKEYQLNVKSITTDNGFEFYYLLCIANKLKIYIYKTDPYASFQKGTIENFNGMVRRFFPKGTNFNKVTDEEIFNVQTKINSCPMKSFDWFSRDELFFNLNYYKEKWNPINPDEQLYEWKPRKWPSNTKRNKFFKNRK
ncbi:transposase [Mycoplasmopsis columboralis]|uniref:Transposase n=1 Tax=Mycoplasmopsis columboralis TaxID=171282 RepID=A0A449B6Z8_9BACT|nr:IS30 family transposase [Mycoplasmopsis columboralis]VEU76369.1 transposase [Mycoplasmopsis columboralis]VEU76374.1 transposase [Mycoplasmopsis columboralis]